MIPLYNYRKDYEYHLEDCDECISGKECRDKEIIGHRLEKAEELAKLKPSDLLLLIIEQLDPHGWLPTNMVYLRVGRDMIEVSTHAQEYSPAIRSLTRKGLIEKRGEYLYYITEDGKMKAHQMYDLSK